MAVEKEENDYISTKYYVILCHRHAAIGGDTL
jgi:hypothetical protein